VIKTEKYTTYELNSKSTVAIRRMYKMFVGLITWILITNLFTMHSE